MPVHSTPLFLLFCDSVLERGTCYDEREMDHIWEESLVMRVTRSRINIREFALRQSMHATCMTTLTCMHHAALSCDRVFV